MDDANKATVEEPLKWFEWMFLENGINHYKDSYFEFYYATDAIVDMDNEKVVYFRPISLEEEVEITEYFADIFKIRLEDEMSIIKKLIDSAIANIAIQDKDPTRFLNLQKNTLYNIQIKSKKYSEKYPFITAILENIFSYVEEVHHKTELRNPQISKEGDKLFEYLSSSSYLTEMKKYLVEKRIIDNADDFTNIFTGKSFDKKINWKTYANWYHYFIDQLSNVPMLRFNKEEKWIVTSQVFTLKGKDIDHTEIKGNNKKPIGKSKIILDDAIKIINQ